MSLGSIIVRLTMNTADFETDAGRAAKVAEKRAKEIDAAFRKAGWAEYVHAPSLVQHIGERTSMGNKPQPSADSFPGEEFDATELLPAAAQVR